MKRQIMGCNFTSSQDDGSSAGTVSTTRHWTIRTKHETDIASRWTKTVKFPAGKHLRKTEFGIVLHEVWDLHPAVPSAESSCPDWYFVHFLWFPTELNGETFTWEKLEKVENSGAGYEIRFHQRRCKLVNRKFTHDGEPYTATTKNLDPRNADYEERYVATLFRGKSELKFINTTDCEVRIRTHSKLETSLPARKTKTMYFDEINDKSLTILVYYINEWQPLPAFTERHIQATIPFKITQTHIEQLKMGLMPSSHHDSTALAE